MSDEKPPRRGKQVAKAERIRRKRVCREELRSAVDYHIARLLLREFFGEGWCICRGGVIGANREHFIVAVFNTLEHSFVIVLGVHRLLLFLLRRGPMIAVDRRGRALRARGSFTACWRARTWSKTAMAGTTRLVVGFHDGANITTPTHAGSAVSRNNLATGSVYNSGWARDDAGRWIGKGKENSSKQSKLYTEQTELNHAVRQKWTFFQIEERRKNKSRDLSNLRDLCVIWSTTHSRFTWAGVDRGKTRWRDVWVSLKIKGRREKDFFLKTRKQRYPGLIIRMKQERQECRPEWASQAHNAGKAEAVW